MVEKYFSNINLSLLKHEAEFFGIAPLVERLVLCEEMDNSSCGDVFFHAYIPFNLFSIVEGILNIYSNFI